MENPDKAPRLEATLKNLDADQHQVLWDLRYKNDEGTKINKSLKAIRMEIPIRYGFTVAPSTVSIFYDWLRQKREWESDVAYANEVREGFRRDHPEATKEELLEVGEIQFTARSMKRGDDKGFVRLLRAITAREKARTDSDKAKQAAKSKIEVGLDALMAEIQASPRAMEIFVQLKAEVAKV